MTECRHARETLGNYNYKVVIMSPRIGWTNMPSASWLEQIAMSMAACEMGGSLIEWTNAVSKFCRPCRELGLFSADDPRTKVPGYYRAFAPRTAMRPAFMNNPGQPGRMNSRAKIVKT